MESREVLFLKMEDLQCIYTLMEMIKKERKYVGAAERVKNCWSMSVGK